MLQIKDFSFTGDFHLIDWPATLKYNAARYVASWIVLAILILLFYRAPDAAALAAVLPLSLLFASFVFYVLGFLSRAGGLFGLIGLRFFLFHRLISIAMTVPGDLILSGVYAFKRAWFLNVFRTIPPLFALGFIFLVDGSQAPGVHTYR